jgi:hypothetical protein
MRVAQAVFHSVEDVIRIERRRNITTQPKPENTLCQFNAWLLGIDQDR